MTQRFTLIFLLALLLIPELTPVAEDDPRAKWREPFNAAETAALDLCLEAANLTLKDLTFERKAEKMPFMLDVVKNFMDDPLYGAKLADLTSRQLYGAAEKPCDALRYLESLLGVTTRMCGTLPGSIAEARRDLAEEWNRLDPDSASKAIAQIDTLPLPIAHAVVMMMWGATIAQLRMTEALEVLSPEERGILLCALPQMVVDGIGNFAPNHANLLANYNTGSLLQIAGKVDLTILTCGAETACAALREAENLLSRFDLAACDTKMPFTSGFYEINTPLGNLVIGDCNDNIYTKPAAFVLDLGGDDTYLAPTACAIYPEPGSTSVDRWPVAFLLDLAGNDRHVGTQGYGCGLGILGIGILRDVSGNDQYDCGHLSLGAGILGVGIMADLTGSDRYTGDTFTTGVGFLGVGLCADGKGDDSYRGALFSQGFGYVMGIGALSDDAGTDIYFAGGKYSHAPLLPDDFQSLSQGCGFGMRNIACGGVGILCDAAGKDFYTGDVYAQGTAYYYAAGILVDGSGNDVYTTTQYSQGAGIHLAAGVLLDRAGNDHYYCRYGVGMGGAHDYAVGLLLDLDGTDFYQGSGITQGGANTNSVAIFLDGGTGADGYSGIGDFLQGKGAQSRDTASIGIMIDMGGDDSYSTGLKNGELRISGIYGIAYDLEPPPVEEEKK